MGEGVIQDDIAVAERALAEYDLAPHSALQPAESVGERHLRGGGRRAPVPGRSCGCTGRTTTWPHEIESELDWLDALRRDGDVTVPTVLPASDGRRVVTVNVDGTDRATSCISRWSPAPNPTRRR